MGEISTLPHLFWQADPHQKYAAAFVNLAWRNRRGRRQRGNGNGDVGCLLTTLFLRRVQSLILFDNGRKLEADLQYAFGDGWIQISIGSAMLLGCRIHERANVHMTEVDLSNIG